MFCKTQDRRQISNTENTQIKYNDEKAINAKHSKNKTTPVQSPYVT